MTNSMKPQPEEVLAIILALLLFQAVFELIRIDGTIDFSKLFVDSAAGFICYLASLLTMKKVLRSSPVATAASVAFLGSCMWVAYKIVKGIALDWSFLSGNFEAIYIRHVSIGIKALIILVPIFTLITFSIFVLLQFAVRKTNRRLD